MWAHVIHSQLATSAYRTGNSSLRVKGPRCDTACQIEGPAMNFSLYLLSILIHRASKGLVNLIRIMMLINPMEFCMHSVF
jgi:hypothetical protein